MSVIANQYDLPVRLVEWSVPGKIEKKIYGDRQIVFECGSELPELCLTLSFPIEGGIRLSTGNAGFFNPSGLKAITRNISDEAEVFSADGLKAKLCCTETGFEIVLSGSGDNRSVTVKNTDILIGTENGKWIKSGFTQPLDAGERICGFGERFNTLNHRGTHFTLWNVDAWSKGTTAYKNIPLYHSSKGHMVFFNSMYSCEADIGAAADSVLKLEFEGPVWDVYFYISNPSQSIKEYTSLTGKPILPPKWALRYWAGGGFQVWEDRGKEKYLEVLEDCISGYEEMGIHDLSALFGEGLPFHNKAAYEILEKTGTRMLAWNHPSLMIEDMQELLKTEKLDEIPYFKDPENERKQAKREVIDFTHPNAVKLISEYFRTFWNWGLKGCMVDYGEILPIESVSYYGKTGDEMHNFLSYWYNKVYYDAWEKELDGDYILFSRSGCAGCQRWSASFGGDQVSEFEGLRQAFNGMLNLTVCGYTFWGTDIGGYGGPPSTEVYIRWLQFGTFNPIMRAHGCGKDRNPWTYGETAVRVFRQLYGLRENMLPYIYDYAVRAHNTGIPMTSMMQTSFPELKSLLNCDEQYMFCDNLLVCPVLKAGADKKAVFFPSGNWYDIFNGKLYRGCRRVIVDAPIEKIPVYVRAGSVIRLELAESGRLFDIAEKSRKLKGLLVAPPEKETENVYSAEGCSYRSMPAENGIFRIESERAEETDIVIVLGTDVCGVFKDGKLLPEAAVRHEDGYTYVHLGDGSFKNIEFHSGKR